MSKNPFEVRLEVLKMAQDMTQVSYDNAYSLAYQLIENLANAQEKLATDLKDEFDKIKPVMYGPDDIIKKADELYQFIMKKD